MYKNTQEKTQVSLPLLRMLAGQLLMPPLLINVAFALFCCQLPKPEKIYKKSTKTNTPPKINSQKSLKLNIPINFIHNKIIKNKLPIKNEKRATVVPVPSVA